MENASWLNGTVTRRMIYPPEPLFSDRVQLALLLLLFLIGAPVNLISLSKLRGTRSLARTGRLALLRLHLNISDLMVLFIYVTARACWLLTYQWRGGDLLCKVVMFLNSTSFQLSSNIIVCVALDRVFTIICGTVFYKKYVNRNPARYVRLCVMASWVVAVGVNVSQFFVWLVISPFPHTAPQWRQCTTCWSAATHFDRLTSLDPSLSEVFYAHAYKPPFQMDKLIYNAFHIVMVFWIPAAVIVFSYTIVVLHMYQLSAKKRNTAKRTAKVGLAVEDNGTQMSHVEMVAMDGHARIIAVPTVTTIAEEEQLTEEGECVRNGSSNGSTKAYLLPVAIHRMRSKTFRMSLLLVSAYFICWTPYNFLALWQFFDEAGYRRYAVGMKFLNVLIVFNSCVNPFLYGTLSCRMPWRKKRAS